MAGQITILLKDTLTEIESLQEYYHWQLKATRKYIKKNVGKYKYAILLDKYFLSLIEENKELELTEEEKELVNEVLESSEVEISENGPIIKYTLKKSKDLSEYELVPEKGRKGFRKLIDRSKILNESTLIILLIKFEECIMGILRFLLENYPDAYLSNKSISYAELINLKEGLQVIKSHFINNEIEEIMRRPIDDWYKLIKDKHKLKYGFDEKSFNEFKKAYYKRNLIVHNQGIINDIYLRNVKDNEYSLGDRLFIDSSYIDQAIMLAKKILIGTFWGLKKLASDNHEVSEFLFNYGYDCLVEQNWELAKYVNKLVMEDDDQQAADILCERVNYWIAQKNSDGIDSIREEVESLDVSIMSPQFVIAKHALLNEFEEVSKALEIAINTEVPAEAVAEWPLFNEYRNSECYAAFVEKHKDKFAVLDYIPECESEPVLEIESDKRKLELIEDLKKSTSFQETHSIINSLNDFYDWTAENIEQLCSIAMSNTQVWWIIDDKDISIFYKNLITSIEMDSLGDCAKAINNYFKEKKAIKDEDNSLEQTKQ